MCVCLIWAITVRNCNILWVVLDVAAHVAWSVFHQPDWHYIYIIPPHRDSTFDMVKIVYLARPPPTPSTHPTRRLCWWAADSSVRRLPEPSGSGWLMASRRAEEVELPCLPIPSPPQHGLLNISIVLHAVALPLRTSQQLERDVCFELHKHVLGLDDTEPIMNSNWWDCKSCEWMNHVKSKMWKHCNGHHKEAMNLFFFF